MKLSNVITILEAWAHPSTAQSYDNVGLHIGDPHQEIKTVLVALEVTPAVVEEAIDAQVDLLVTHHPLLFRPLRHIRTTDWTGHLVLRLARSGMALYTAHTNLDSAQGGVSFALADRLGLKDVSFLAPSEEQTKTDTPTGMGAIGDLPSPESLALFLEHVADRLGANALRYTGRLDRAVQRIAVCGGSGSDLIDTALRREADVYVTADVTYHRFFEVLHTDGTPRMALVDAGHYESERLTEELLIDFLSREFPSLNLKRTAHRTSPIQTYVRRSLAP